MILLIDNYDSFTYNLYQMLMMITDKVQVARNDQISLEQIRELNPEKIVLSPGPGRPEEAGLCVDIVKQFSEQTPILGVCLGHQAIAYAFGGAIITAPDIVHGKAYNVFHCNQNVLKDLPQPFSATRYHSLIVEREGLPETLMITAENSDGLIMGLRHKTRPCFGVQFHPESIISEAGEKLLRNFVR